MLVARRGILFSKPDSLIKGHSIRRTVELVHQVLRVPRLGFQVFDTVFFVHKNILLFLPEAGGCDILSPIPRGPFTWCHALVGVPSLAGALFIVPFA